MGSSEPRIGEAEPRRTGDSSRFWQVGVATLVVGVSGYAVLILAAPALGAAGYASFAVFWSVVYFIAGTIFGAQQEITRSVRASAGENSQGNARVVAVGGAIAAVVFVAVFASSWIWADTLFGQRSAVIVTCVLAGSVLYSGLAVLAGALSGKGEWQAYSWLLVADALVRLVLVALVVSFGASLVGLAVATVSGMGVWLFALLVSGRSRSAFAARGDAPFGKGIAQAIGSVLGTASTAALVTGFAAMIKLTVPDAPATELGVVILVVTLTRAPILMPINAYLGVAVSSFYDHRSSGIRVLAKPALLVAGGGLLLSACAAALGPWLVTAVFGPDFTTSWWLIGLAMVAATLIGLLSLTGAAALAFGHHRAYALGWVLAAVIAVTLLLFPLDLSGRVLLALLVAPFAGIIIHVIAVGRTAPVASPKVG